MQAVQERRDITPKTHSKSLVWFGALPALQSIDMQVPTPIKDSITRDFFKIEKQDPAELWTNPQDARIWIGKCRFYQSLGVRGFVFPAFSEAVERHATIETETVAVPFPGAVTILKQHEVDTIVKSCFRHVVRFRGGNDNIYSLKNQGKVQVVDLDQVVKPAAWTDAQWQAERQRIPMEIPSFDPDTDVPIAEFVYLVQIHVPDFNSLMNREAVLDVGAAITYLPNQRLDRKFFSNPPKSVAEMYPQKVG